jgi:hypothetical protein
MLFLLDTAAAVVGCESLPLVSWGVELVPLLMTETLWNRTSQKGKYTSNRGTYEGALEGVVTPAVDAA